MNTGKAHGSALGDEEVAATKRILGFDPDKTFEVREEVITTPADWWPAARKPTRAGNRSSRRGQARAERKALLDRLLAQELPRAGTPTFRTGSRVQALATRAASGECCPRWTETTRAVGGSADWRAATTPP